MRIVYTTITVVLVIKPPHFVGLSAERQFYVMYFYVFWLQSVFADNNMNQFLWKVVSFLFSFASIRRKIFTFCSFKVTFLQENEFEKFRIFLLGFAIMWTWTEVLCYLHREQPWNLSQYSGGHESKKETMKRGPGSDSYSTQCFHSFIHRYTVNRRHISSTII